MRAGQKCQRLLTVWERARGGVLERGERRVDCERVSERDDARQVGHLQVAVAVDALAHNHLATLVHDLGTHLLGRALDLECLDVIRFDI